MRFSQTLCISLGGLVWLACATPPPPQTTPAQTTPANSNGTMIAIAISIDVPYQSDEQADQVNFVRLDDPIASGQILSSNFYYDGYAYLLNAVPGRYTVVTATSVRHFVTGSGPDSRTKHIYVPARLCEEIASTVSAGEIVFLGEVLLDARGDWGDADETQLRYLDELAPGYWPANFWRREFRRRSSDTSHVASARYEIDRGPVARQRFLESARSRFAETEWASHFAHSVAAPAPSGE